MEVPEIETDSRHFITGKILACYISFLIYEPSFVS